MTDTEREIVVLDTPDAVADEAARRWLALAEETVEQRGKFMVALSGGSTPRALYERLAHPPYQEGAPWAQTHVFWGDERTVPPGHEDSNYRMAHQTLLSRVAVPLNNIHRPHGDKDPGEAATDYEQVLRLAFNLRRDELPRFDLILLGMGDDGHTASLFPGNPALEMEDRLFVATYVPQHETHRLTLTLPAINAARRVIFLVVGEGKAETLRRVLEGESDPSEFPARLVQPDDGQLTWLLDEAAASRLAT